MIVCLINVNLVFGLHLMIVRVINTDISVVFVLQNFVFDTHSDSC